MFTIYHSFCVCHNFLGLIGKKLSEGEVETSLLPDYIIDDNDTPNGDNDINDNYDDENHINDNNKNNDHNHNNDYNDDDNDNSYDKNNGAQTIMTLQTIFFGEPLVCEKAEFCESIPMLMRFRS